METVSQKLAAAGLTAADPVQWKITSANSGLQWFNPIPIIEPGTAEVLHLDYFQTPLAVSSTANLTA